MKQIVWIKFVGLLALIHALGAIISGNSRGGYNDDKGDSPSMVFEVQQSLLEASHLARSTPCQEVYNTSGFHDHCQAYFHQQGNECQTLENRDNKLWQRYQRELLLQNTSFPSCKTVWITGMGIGYDDSGNSKKQLLFQTMYAAALNSARTQGLLDNLLQPVIVLLTPPQQQPPQQHSIQKFVAWAEQQGVVVLQVHSLSFQDLVLEAYPNYANNGALSYYLRFDIPKILRDPKNHEKLFNNHTNVCHSDDVVFYTDNDIVFVNPIPPAEFHHLKNKLSHQHFLMYGQDYLMHRPKPCNTGIMFMHLHGFDHAWEDRIKPWGQQLIQQYRGQQNGTVLHNPFTTGQDWWFPPHDQLWLNFYYIQPKLWKPENLWLPPTWNWKVYWGIPDVQTIYIVHFHGPKPNQGIQEAALCNVDAMVIPRNKTYSFPQGYQMFLASSMCCDHGRTSHRILDLYGRWQPTDEQVKVWWQ